MKPQNGASKTRTPAQHLTLSAREIRRSTSRVAALDRVHRQRLRRRLSLNWSDLDPVGRGFFEHYCRAESKLDLADRFFEEHGYIGEDGSMTAIALHYSTLLNTASRALKALEAHVEAVDRDDLYERYRVIDAEEEK